MERTGTADVLHGRHRFFYEGPKQKDPEPQQVKKVFYGAWDGAKQAVESQSPTAWKQRILGMIETRIVPILNDKEQRKVLDNWETVEKAATYAGIGITAAEIAALIGTLYLGKRYVDILRRGESVTRRIRKKPYRKPPHHPNVSIDLATAIKPDPRDNETLKEFSASLDRIFPDRPIAYRTRKGEVRVLPRHQKLWKRKATAALGEILQKVPDLPPEYVDMGDNSVVRRNWYDPNGPMKIYQMRLDEPSVRERLAESMIRAWAGTRGVMESGAVRELLPIWKKMNLVGIPRTEPHDMAQFISRHIEPRALSDYAKQMLTSTPSPKPPDVLLRMQRIVHLRDPAPLENALYDRPVQHAIQRISAVNRRKKVHDMRRSIQMEHVAEGIWIHRKDTVITQGLRNFMNAQTPEAQKNALISVLKRLGEFRFTNVDRWALWKNDSPTKEIPALTDYIAHQGFPGILDLARGLANE